MKTLPDLPNILWLETYGAYEPESSLKGDVSVEVAIIGGGYTGLITAYELLCAEPSLKVAVFEAKEIGYGSSGRNGSFGMTVVGLGFGVTAMLRGKEFLKDAHAYMERAVDRMSELIQEEGLDCDYSRPGFLRVATTSGYVKRIRHEVELMRSLGFKGIEWIDAEAVRARVNSPLYLGAMWEPRLVLVNPAKLVREEKRLAVQRGAAIYENTPIVEIASGGKAFTLKTPEGVVHAEKIVFATNAYSHLFPQLRRKQTPAFTYMIATEPLTPDQLEPVGWEGREGVEDARNMLHYYRITPDNRLVIGGGQVGLTFGSDLDADDSESAWRHLQNHMQLLFPSFKDVGVEYRWGGPVSVTVNMTPALGYIGDERAVYSLGCIGHGVSMSHLNGQTLRDLILERQTDLLDCPFVNPRVIPWPPEPLKIMLAQVIRGYLRLEDWVHERRLPRH